MVNPMPTVASIPTNYSNVNFRSRLEARWACFFDLLEWHWDYEPIDLNGWIPDFYVKFPCGHSECPGYHHFYAEVKPYFSLKEFDQNPECSNFYGERYGLDGTMYLGINPYIAEIDFAHGSGGGIDQGLQLFQNWSYGKSEHEINQLWKEAGNKTQWKKH